MKRMNSEHPLNNESNRKKILEAINKIKGNNGHIQGRVYSDSILLVSSLEIASTFLATVNPEQSELAITLAALVAKATKLSDEDLQEVTKLTKATLQKSIATIIPLLSRMEDLPPEVKEKYSRLIMTNEKLLQYPLELFNAMSEESRNKYVQDVLDGKPLNSEN